MFQRPLTLTLQPFPTRLDREHIGGSTQGILRGGLGQAHLLIARQGFATAVHGLTVLLALIVAVSLHIHLSRSHSRDIHTRLELGLGLGFCQDEVGSFCRCAYLIPVRSMRPRLRSKPSTLK